MDSLFMNAFYAAFDNDDTRADFIADGLPPVATMDKYRGQPMHPQEFELFALPAIFVGTKIKWTRTGQKYNGLCTFQFHVVLDKTWEVSNIATNRETGLQQTDILKKIRYVLDGIKCPTVGTMTRSDEDELDAEVVTYQVMTYTAAYYDDVIIGADGKVMTTPEGMVLNGKLVTNL